MNVNKKRLICSMIDSDMNNQQLSSATGLSRVQISRIRNGHGTSYESICKIAKALKVSLEYLIEEEGEEKINLQAYKKKNYIENTIKEVEFAEYQYLNGERYE